MITKIAHSFGPIPIFLRNSWLITGQMLSIWARIGNFTLCIYSWANSGRNVVDQQCSWTRSGTELGHILSSTHFIVFGPDLGRGPSRILGQNKPTQVGQTNFGFCPFLWTGRPQSTYDSCTQLAHLLNHLRIQRIHWDSEEKRMFNKTFLILASHQLQWLQSSISSFHYNVSSVNEQC